MLAQDWNLAYSIVVMTERAAAVLKKAAIGVLKKEAETL